MWKNKLRRLLSVILATTLLCSHWTGFAVKAESEQVVYVSASGSDENTGTTAEAPVATLAKAYELLLEGDVKENAEAQAYIVVMDALAAIGNFNYDENGALTYTHAGKVTLTGSYGGQTYGEAKLEVETSSHRYFQCGGPTKITDLTINANGSKQLFIYGGTSLEMTSTAKCTGSYVRVYGGYSYVSGVAVENTQLDIACDTLGYVYGSEGMVTGNVLINLDGTSVTKMLSPGVNQSSASSPKTATLNIQGNADVTLLPINGNGTTDMDKVTVNLYGGRIQELRSGRGGDSSLKELELNIYSGDSMPSAYKDAGTIDTTAITLSGVTTELSSWNFPSADTIKLVENTEITLTAAFPAPASALTVAPGSKLLLAKDANPDLPSYTGEGTVAWIDGGSGDDTPQASAVEAVYVASTGSDENSGLTTDAPVKTLEQAYKIISESTTASDETVATTIVLMDVVELTENFIGDVDYTHKGTVRITSYYNDVDYRVNGAKLRINMAGSKVIAFGGPTILEKVKFARINVENASYVTTNLYTGPNLRLGAEVELVGGEGDAEVTANKNYRFQIRSGNYSTESGDVTVHMSSGSCYFLMAASNKKNVNGNVVITVDGTASPWYITGGGEANGKINGTVTINVTGDSYVRRVYASSTYEGDPEELCTVNISGGTVAVLAGGRTAGSHLKNLVVNVSGEGSAPAEMSLKNTKGGGTIEHFTLSLDGQSGTYSPDWSQFDKLIVKGNSHIAVASLFENVELEVESGSSVFLAAPNVTLPEWTGLGGAAEKGDVWLEERDTQLGDVLLSVDFEEDAKDSSTHGRDGVIYGDVRFVTGMNGGKAVFFNNEIGQTAQQYIDFGDVDLGDEDFTISFWMKTTLGGTVSGSVSAGTPYDMSTLWPGLNAGVLLSNQRFDTPDYNGFSLINAGCYMYFGSSLMAGDERYQIDSVKEPTDDRWHQIVVTVTRKGMEHIYVDGTLCASVFIGDSDGQTIDAGSLNEHLILGADGLGQYGVKNVTVDDLRVYSGVMNSDQIQAEAYLGQTLNLVRELKERGVTAGTQYSQSAIDEIMVKAEAAKAAAEKQLDDKNYNVTEAEGLYRDFRSAYEQFLMGNEALVSFLQVSDTHVESIGSARYEAMQKALDWANELGIDACLHSGDYSNNGAVAEIEAFWDVYKTKKGFLKTFIAIGNHEVRALSSSEFSELHIGALVDAGAVESGYDKLYYEGEVNGYHILVLSAYLKDYKNYDAAQGMEEEQLRWLDEKLAAYSDQGKPVFVLIHPCVTEQLEQLGQYRVPPTTIVPESIYDIFAKYPDAVVATGHIHHGLGDGSGVFQMQSGYHVLDIPAFLQNNSGYGTKSTEPSGSHHVGYFTYVYEDVIQYRAVDFATGEWLTAYDQTIKINTKASEDISGVEETTEAEGTTEWEETTAAEETTEAEEITESEEINASEETNESEKTIATEGMAEPKTVVAPDYESSDDSLGTPDTGDDFQAGLWLLVAVMAFSVGMYMFYQKKQSK